MRTLWIALRALVYGTGFILLWGWLALSARVYDTQLGVALPAWLVVPGMVVCMIGLLLALTCVMYFVGSGRGTPAPFDPPAQFVAVGPYTFVRNPMYLGGVVALTGAAFWLKSVAVLVLSAGFIGLFHLFVVFYEEPALGVRFGQSYLDYKRMVNRWLPKRPTRKHELEPSGNAAA